MKRRIDEESSGAGSQSKKQRGQEPSRVLFLSWRDARGPAPTHDDIDDQLGEFNQDPLRIFILEKKSNAFVEFSNVDSAMDAFEHFTAPGRQFELRGGRCEMQYSDKNKVSIPDSQQQFQPARGGRRRNDSRGRGSRGRNGSTNGRGSTGFRSFSADDRDRGRNGQPSGRNGGRNDRGRDGFSNGARERNGTTDSYYERTDRRDSDRRDGNSVVVHTDFVHDNTRNPPRADEFNVDNIIPIFAKCGVMHRIVIFCRERDGNKRWQCMTEYAEPRYAQYAVKKIGGQFFNDYRMDVKPSQADTLNVSSNSDRSFNFLEPELGLDPSPMNGRAAPHPGYEPRRNSDGSPMMNSAAPGFFSSRGSRESFPNDSAPGGPCVLVRGLPDNLPVDDKPRIVFNLFSCYGYVTKIKVMHKNPNSAVIQYFGTRASEFASLAVKYLHNVPFMGVKLQVEAARMNEVTVQDTNEWGGLFVDADQRWPAKYFDQRFDKALTGPTASLHVSQIPAELPEDDLKSEIESIDNTKYAIIF